MDLEPRSKHIAQLKEDIGLWFKRRHLGSDEMAIVKLYSKIGICKHLLNISDSRHLIEKQ